MKSKLTNYSIYRQENTEDGAWHLVASKIILLSEAIIEAHRMSKDANYPIHLYEIWQNYKSTSMPVGRVEEIEADIEDEIFSDVEEIQSGTEDMRLKDIITKDFNPEDYSGERVIKRLNDKVIAKYDAREKEWVGKKYHKYVTVWFELETGWAVGMNENPSKGLSFPVIRMPKS